MYQCKGVKCKGNSIQMKMRNTISRGKNHNNHKTGTKLIEFNAAEMGHTRTTPKQILVLME